MGVRMGEALVGVALPLEEATTEAATREGLEPDGDEIEMLRLLLLLLVATGGAKWMPPPPLPLLALLLLPPMPPGILIAPLPAISNACPVIMATSPSSSILQRSSAPPGLSLMPKLL